MGLGTGTIKSALLRIKFFLFNYQYNTIIEPIAAQGSFVINTQQELSQVMTDYQQGRLGRHF